MPKFRMLIRSADGNHHISNAFDQRDAVLAAGRAKVMLGAEPELISETRTLRRTMAQLDAQAAEILARAPDVGINAVPLPMVWSRPIHVDVNKACNCAKCQAVRAAVEISSQIGVGVAGEKQTVEQEHPYFAAPNLKYGQATIEEEEPASVPIRRQETGDRRQGLADYRRGAWKRFMAVDRPPGLSWRGRARWALLSSLAFAALLVATAVSLAVEGLGWFIAKEPRL